MIDIILKTNNIRDIQEWMEGVLDFEYNRYLELCTIEDKNLEDFIKASILETLTDYRVHLGTCGVLNAGNLFLQEYDFWYNPEEKEYRIVYKNEEWLYPGEFKMDWTDWSLWIAYDECVKNACENFNPR